VQQIGRYQILGELGRGAMGIVYKAQDPAIGRTIAIKSIRLEDLTDEPERERLRERLFREAQSAGILSHPGIVTIYDIAEENGMAYIFMEFVNGPPLEKMLLRAQTPDKETLISILRQTAAALDYAHKKGIVHRDIKPANIMIHEDGTAKVTDFGVAKIVSQQMTLAGTMMGTPSYMSPEQVQGGTISGRADQFSLAVIAYEALTGEKPFVADYLPTLLYKIVREDPMPAQRLNTTLGLHVDSVLRKALAKNPADRHENCVDFVSALATACNETLGWMPLPRGASQNMPTVGSQEGLMAETVGDVAPPAPPQGPRIPQTAKPEQLIAPRPGRKAMPPPESNVARNVILAAAVVALVCICLFALVQKLAQSANHTAAVAQTPAASQPAEEKPVPPPPPPDPAPEDATAVAPAKETRKETPSEATASAPPVVRTTPTVPSPKSPPEAGDATFHVTTSPPGATVIFDSNAATKCVSPCDVTLPSGRHTFAVRHAGYRDAFRIIEMPRDTGLIVDLARLTGTLSVISNPPGLTVLIDGQEQAKKTPASLTLPVGRHSLEVIKGNDKKDFEVNIQDGLISSKFIEWAQ
jgi:serine/threonine protein kinase